MDTRVSNLLSASQYAPITQQKSKNGASSDGKQTASSGTVSISSQAQTLWSASQSNGGGNYDFTNMTPETMQSTMNSLIRSGKMSLDESSALVTTIPTALSKVNYDGQAPQAYTQPTNFINLLQNGIAAANARSDSASVKNLTSALSALQKLQGTSIQG